MQRSCLLGYIKSGRLRELGRQTWNKIGAGCFGFGAESANSKYGVQLDDLATLGCVEAIRCQIQILGSNKHFGADQQLGARNSFLGTRNKYTPLIIQLHRVGLYKLGFYIENKCLLIEFIATGCLTSK